MTQDPSSAIGRLVMVHAMLALAPLGMGLLTSDMRMLPVAWALAAVTFAQIMLLAIWLGMTGLQKLPQKSLASVLAVAFISIWHAIAQVSMSPVRSLSQLASAYVQNLVVIFVLLGFLALVLFGASKLFGIIGLPHDTRCSVAEPRFRFSLLVLLALATAVAVILGLVRIAQTNVRPADDAERAVDYVLAIVIYGLNTLATIWATLGPGHVIRRVCAVMVVSVLLGLSIAAALASPAIEIEGWWLFASRSVVVIVPTAIVVLSLLYLRRHGYRLISLTTQSSPPPQTV